MKKLLYSQITIIYLLFLLPFISSNPIIEENNNLNSEVYKEEYNYKEGQIAATLTVPTRKIESDIVYGTDYLDNSTLIMDNNYSLFGNKTSDVVVAGHKEVIGKEIQRIELNDIIEINTVNNKEYRYQVKMISKPYEGDAEEFLSNSNNSEDLIIYTCYPFGIWSDNSQRYLIEAELIDSTDSKDEFLKTSLRY